ncbi:MAG: RidA family protein [Bryobacteraceae bacterium]
MSTRRKMLTAAAAAAVPAAAQSRRAQARSGGRVKEAHWFAPKPAGTPLYSEAISYGDMVFVSGHGVAQGDIRQQTKEVLDRIEGALKAAGSSLDKALKVNVYLQNLDDYKAMNETYLGRFGATPPVRTTVAVAGIPLAGALVEIECIAHR